jgi:hypothetical protein
VGEHGAARNESEQAREEQHEALGEGQHGTSGRLEGRSNAPRAAGEL